MSIGKNIAKYRKLKGLTQEELGERVGVTNQAVSKWESEASMPDVMLLPKITEALDITLNDLYGIENPKVCADDFPEESYSLLCKFFFEQSGARFNNFGSSNGEQLEGYFDALRSGKHLTCISDTFGVVDICRDIAVIDTSYKKESSEGIIGSDVASRALEYLSDKNFRKVFEYQYKESFRSSDKGNSAFTVQDIRLACDMSEDEALDVLTRFEYLSLSEKDIDEISTVYYFKKSQAFYVLAIFKLARLLISKKVHLVLRDTSTIDDYTF